MDGWNGRGGGREVELEQTSGEDERKRKTNRDKRNNSRQKKTQSDIVEWTQICRCRIDKYRSRHRYAELLMLLEMYRGLEPHRLSHHKPGMGGFFWASHLVGSERFPLGLREPIFQTWVPRNGPVFSVWWPSVGGTN